jgi:4-diphosphocytidyl-2-C-methyl-D-erythritol kinase
MILENNSFTRLTLALDIVRKITDGPYRGFHELGTIKHRIDLCDTLTVEDAPRDTLACDNPAVPCDDRNVCMKVLRLVKTAFSIDRCARISILKRIPVMGGLAGGSANAATTFEMLNSLWDLKLSQDQMIRLSRGIGMDVPYYFIGGTAFDSEAGECLEPIATALTFTFILALPDFGVSTAEAYGALDYAVIGKQTALTATLRKALISGDAGGILSLLHNDFEAPVFSRYARLAEIKKNLVHAGCLASVLTGSGSTVLGIAHDRAHAEAVIKRLDCRAIIASTLKAG